MNGRPRMVITGASGLIGRGLIEALRDRWHVTVLTREVNGDEPAADEVLAWNPKAAKQGDTAHLEGLARRLEGIDALVNLAGSRINEGRFDDEHKRLILESRVDAATTLVEAVARCELAPKTWFQASGSGIYGDRGDEVLDESSDPGEGFLADVARAVDAAVEPAAQRSRVVHGRIGIVFAPEATAWRRLVLPIRLFVGGPIAGGRMWWPWIHHRDLIRAITWLLETPEVTLTDGTVEPVEGVYALTGEPARQVDITRAAARILRRPSFVPVPAFALRILFGGMPDHLLFPSTRLRPAKLERQGFDHDFGSIDEAARELLTR